MRLPEEWTIFPLYPIIDGKCGCNKEGCQNVGKHPAYKWSELLPGEKVAPPDGWGIGLATGARSGVFVVDLDVKPALGIDGLESLAALGEMPPTRSVRTPTGGWHLYFRWPGFKVQNSASKLGPGIDVRGDGGYVVLPDSPHKKGGRYEFFGDPETPIADAPPWLLEKLQAGNAGAGVPGPLGGTFRAAAYSGDWW